MKPVVIFGIGDFAQVACSYFRHDAGRTIAAFTVHAAFRSAEKVLGLDVVPFETLERTHPATEFDLFVAIGYRRLNKAREEIYEQCRGMGYGFSSFVHSRACVAADVVIGANCFIFEQNVVQPFVTIGDDVVLWSGNHIGHHAKIGSHCFIASHAVISGRVEIGDHSFIGVNSTFKDGVRVAPRNVIGAGAIITRDTQDDEVYAPEATAASKVKSYQVRGLK